MRIKFGVAGTGHWAEQVHLAVLRSRPDVNLVGVWGRNPEKAAQTAAAFGARAFSNVQEMLAEVDAVSFALPPDVQAELAALSASAGKHLLLEKPLALTPEAAGRVVQAVDSAGVAAVVFFTRVFTRDMEQRVQDLAAQGPWNRCTGHYHGGALRPGTPYSSSVWRQVHGALWDLGPHLLSILLPVLGPVAAVQASREPGDVVRLRFSHTPGSTSEVTLTLHAPKEECGEAYVFTADGRRADLTVPPAPRQQAYGAAVDALLAAIAGRPGEGARHGVRAAAEVTAILHAADRSLRQGAAVAV